MKPTQLPLLVFFGVVFFVKYALASFPLEDVAQIQNSVPTSFSGVEWEHFYIFETT